MATITGLNMIKSVFAALGAKTSDSNYAVPLLNKTTAEPKGYMDMASLASVLGDILFGSGGIEITSSTDMDSLTSPGIYVCKSQSIASTLVNLPDGTNFNAFHLLVFCPYGGSSYAGQLLVYRTSLFIRHRNSSGLMNSWRKVTTETVSA